MPKAMSSAICHAGELATEGGMLTVCSATESGKNKNK